MKRSLVALFIMGGVLIAAGSRRSRSPQEGEVTFNNQVVRLFQRNCQVCHHPGDIGPFSLMTYSEARVYASLIKQKTQAREMPPWKPVQGCGEFEGERRLTEDEIATIARWVDSGSPEGSPADLPPPLTFTDGWPLGEPDVVLQPDADYLVNPGRDIYRCFSIPTDLRGDRFLSAVEVKPGNRSVVHHVIIYLDETGISKQLDDADPGPGYTCFGGAGFMVTGTLGGWAPGARSAFEPAGGGWRLPRGARVVIQVHYHPRGGGSEIDRTQIGLYYARKPVKKELLVLPLVNTSFAIPAGDPRYKVTASGIVPPGFDAHAIAIAPHMHLLGREMTVEATYTDGTTRCLIHIDNWDFQWQGVYHFKEQVPLTAFTRLNLTAFYDNSENNPLNPNNPPRVVRWGEQTTDEMCIAFIEFTLDSESRELSSPEIARVGVDGSDRLVVAGKGFLAGSDIEVDGRRLGDTVNHKKKAAKKLLSSDDWKSLIPPARQVAITVLNPDGVRSAPMNFVR